MSAALIFIGAMVLGIFFSAVIAAAYVITRIAMPEWCAPFVLAGCALLWAYVLF